MSLNRKSFFLPRRSSEVLALKRNVDNSSFPLWKNLFIDTLFARQWGGQPCWEEGTWVGQKPGGADPRRDGLHSMLYSFSGTPPFEVLHFVKWTARGPAHDVVDRPSRSFWKTLLATWRVPIGDHTVWFERRTGFVWLVTMTHPWLLSFYFPSFQDFLTQIDRVDP